MSFSTLCHERFSARKYIDKKVEEEKIVAILEAGRVAPTAKNNQPQRIYLLKSEEALQKIREITPARSVRRWFCLFAQMKAVRGLLLSGKITIRRKWTQQYPAHT